MRRPGATMHRNSFVAGAALLAACLAIAACGSSTEVASSTVATAASTVETTAAPATTSPETTATTSPPTTAAPTSMATTVPPPPTTAPPTTAPPTTAPPVTTSPSLTPLPGPKPATAFLTADDQLLEVDAATGATVRVIDEFFSGDGVFRGGLRLSPDRGTIWYSEGYEDSWYSCEASVGSWGRIDAATGAVELLGSGSGVEPSADGQFVSYVTSGVCVPDPDQPEIWVLTPPDRVIVRELATGEEREYVTDTAPADYAAPSAVSSAIFSPDGNLLVLLGDGRLIDVDLNGSSVIQDHPVALPEVSGNPVSAAADALITVEFGDEGSSDVYAIDAAGAPSLIASAGAFMAVGVSAEGHVVVSSLEPVTVSPGVDVTVLELPGDSFVFDLDW